MAQPISYPERIRLIKERREELNWSQQYLVDMVFETGGITSLGTVKRVLASGSESKNFKDITLTPIEKALGLLDRDSEDISPVTERFYQDIIFEQKRELQLLHNDSLIKTFFFAVLFVFELVKNIYDRIYLGGGWFTPSNSVGWVFSVVFLVVFALAYIVYVLYRKAEHNSSKGGR